MRQKLLAACLLILLFSACIKDNAPSPNPNNPDQHLIAGKGLKLLRTHAFPFGFAYTTDLNSMVVSKMSDVVQGNQMQYILSSSKNAGFGQPTLIHQRMAMHIQTGDSLAVNGVQDIREWDDRHKWEFIPHSALLTLCTRENSYKVKYTGDFEGSYLFYINPILPPNKVPFIYSSAFGAWGINFETQIATPGGNHKTFQISRSLPGTPRDTESFYYKNTDGIYIPHPDGLKAYLVSTGPYNIFLHRTDTTYNNYPPPAFTLPQQAGFQKRVWKELKFSPDGKKVCVVVETTPNAYDNNHVINSYVLDMDANQLRPVTTWIQESSLQDSRKFDWDYEGNFVLLEEAKSTISKITAAGKKVIAQDYSKDLGYQQVFLRNGIVFLTGYYFEPKPDTNGGYLTCVIAREG